MAKRNWADGVLGNTPLSADRLNHLESDLSASLAALARDPESLFAGAVTYDGNGAPISAVVKWPDGIDGTYAGTVSVNFPGAVSAYTITRILNGSTVTYTQPAITRDATTGNVTNRPPIVITGETVDEYLYPDPVAPSDLDAALVSKINDTGSDTRAALSANYVPQSVIDTTQAPHAAQITTTSDSGKNGLRIVNAANSYGLKVDQSGAGGVHDAVNIAANFTGAHTPFSVNSNNTTLSTVKILNPAAQTGGAVIVGIGSSAARTAQIIQADNYGAGASFLATQEPGSTGVGLQVQYVNSGANETYTSRAVWVQARHASGDAVYIENASDVAQTSGSLMTIVQPNTGSTAPCLTLSPFGTGPGLKINASGASILLQVGNNFTVDSNGAIRAPQWVNSTSFNNARIQMPTTGLIVDRNVNDSNPVLTVQGLNASAPGNLQEWKNSAGTIVARVRNNGCIVGLTSTTALRPSPSLMGVGAQYYDTTLGKPVWSDGTSWRDAMGTSV